MCINIVKAHVIHRCHELCTSGLAHFICNLKRPCFLLSGREFVAESNPFRVKFQFRFGTTNSYIMAMEHTIFHPSISQCDAVMIFFLIFQGTCTQFIIQRKSATFKHLAARKHAIVHHDIMPARTYLHIDRLAIFSEMVTARIEPILCFVSRLLVFQREYRKRTVQRILATDSFQNVVTTLQLPKIKRNRLVSIGLIYRIVYLIVYLCGNILTGKVLIIKGEMQHTVALYAFGQPTIEISRTVTEREIEAPLMAFAGTIGDRCTHFNDIITRHVVLSFGHSEHYRHMKIPFLVCLNGVCLECLLIFIVTSPPIPIRPTGHSIDHLGTLHRNPGIAFGRALHMDCVTILIGLCIRSEVNGKRRTLVFLNMKICLVIFVGFYRKRTCLSRFRKIKRCIGRSIGIGDHFLRCYLVIFSIIEFQCDAVGYIDRSLFRLVILLKVNQAHVDLLSGTVETAVCEKLDIILYEIIFIVFYIVFTR